MNVGERVARLESKVDDIATDVGEIRLDIRTLIDTLDKRYVTRNEMRVTQWLIGLAVAVIGLFLSFKDHIK